MALWRKASNDTAYTAASIRDTYNSSGLAITKGREKSWQSQVRGYVEEGPGFVGFALDLKALLASMGQISVVDSDDQEIDDQYVQGTVGGIRWITDIRQNVFQGVFQRNAVGEYWSVYTPKGWMFATTPQLYPDKGPITHILLREGVEKKDLDDMEKALPVLSAPQRHIVPSVTFSGEATSPVRRALKELESYSLLIQGIINDRASTSQWAKLLYLGEDDGKWRQDPEYAKAGVPPLIKEFYTLGKGREYDTPAQTYATMGPTAPIKIPMADPIDPQLLAMLEYHTRAFARSMNMPARVLTDESGNHWSDYLVWDNLITMGVKPDLDAVLDVITEVMWRPGIKKLKEQGIIPININPERCRLRANMENVARTQMDPSSALQMWIHGVINREQVLKTVNLPESAMFELPPDYTENELRLESISRSAINPGIDPNVAGTAVAPPKQASAVTAAITKTTYKQVKGRSRADRLNRLELKTWGQLQGTLNSELSAMLADSGKAIVRQLTDSKTDSAKEQLDVLKPLAAKTIVFASNRSVLAANGIDLNESLKKHKKILAAAIAAILASATLQRSRIIGRELPDRTEKASQVASNLAVAYVLNHRQLGEFALDQEEQISAPSYIARDVLRVAGGGDTRDGFLQTGRDGTVLQDNKPYLGGFSTGPDVQHVLQEEGQTITWEWFHDDPTTPYPDHEALDGVQYTDEERDSVLGGNFVGDHIGCLCQEFIVLGDNPGNDLSSEESS